MPVGENIEEQWYHRSVAISRAMLRTRSSGKVVGSALRHCVISPAWDGSSGEFRDLVT